MSSAPSDPHWCYHCNKRVIVETLDDFVVCSECNKGFVESIEPIPAAPQRSPPLSPDLRVEDSSIGSHFLQMLRLLTHAPSPPRLDVLSYEDEFFGLEINSRNEIEDEEDDDEEEEEEEEEDDREEMFPITTRSITGRNRILDWAEILMGIEDNSDRYTGGNAADYVDDGAGYETLLQNLAEGDGGGGRRGAPPAAKSAVEALETFEVGGSCDKMIILVCAVCKDAMVNGETVKKLPCGHCYHGNCILPWLGTRNSCPVCRFQLKTDDAEYEEERKKRTTTINTTTALADSSAASSST
ncbi:hypothetical protein Bca4012_067779 [Brassica carinata]|uniref:RING-type E3 ubiquitin transferase n=1 Tax=Brassica carinata TaxID=52824 RepID=A0A8X7VSL4_BRACI|nr:hypothetical protein Bca52824_019998 [Brassica carinata]